MHFDVPVKGNIADQEEYLKPEVEVTPNRQQRLVKEVRRKYENKDIVQKYRMIENLETENPGDGHKENAREEQTPGG